MIRKPSTSKKKTPIPARVIVLAAGRSTRMKSERSKLLHELRGRPILDRTIENAAAIGAVDCVLGKGAGEIEALARGRGANIIVQDPPLGTGHAVQVAVAALPSGFRGDIIILNGDVPLASPELLRAVLAFHSKERAALTVVTTEPPDPAQYGRVITRGNRLKAIVEALDAAPSVRAIREINSGIYCARVPDVLSSLRRLRNKNAKKEYYLTDIVGLLNKAGKKVVRFFHPAWRELLGINDRVDLEEAECTLNLERIRQLQRSGVTVLSAATTFVGEDVSVGADTVLHPCTVLEGRTQIGRGSTIYPFTRIVDSTLGAGVTVNGSSLIVDSSVEEGAVLGPYCHLRGGTTISAGAKVGNFVEMKKTTFGAGSKAMHLTYLGDATVGESVNVGAGTITCNYDGVKKHPTSIGAGVFVGSGTELVAPVSVGADAYIAAGSTITEDVPAGALAIARGRQVNKPGWVAKKRRRSGSDRR